jgi:tetratricopeptide (TPR) repeat protein
MINITPAGLSRPAAGYLRNGMLKEAEVAYHELVTKNPLNAYFLERLAMVYEKEQLYKKAVVYYERALSLSDGYRKKERIKKALKRLHTLSGARNY